ncbi:hypothetical protein [Paenibacillus graminis]|uniref:hypothetical protein n=1 Tax=Paenibacillus graminis TaxID=189425 RepID=UPI0004B21C5E|nr:hypothetical protein [Paenibacillus graminis]
MKCGTFYNNLASGKDVGMRNAARKTTSWRLERQQCKKSSISCSNPPPEPQQRMKC